ncbi:EamA domain-containing membrane protein RarD [Humitalea rosea]|uniref:EamA domain-containing membrane protein RarD n=1 Tax=Humitalea rosea TaxID=990373 RepID=A0A2W7JFI3_9PROT|nr:DMT family transporter [Humitalea rosea]PZW50793.1 EamA domain-containing membrane protein RarD [Humitalea rosea]
MAAVTSQGRAILGVLGAAGCFALSAGCVKALDGVFPVAQLILCRNVFAFPALLPVLLASGGWRAMRTANPWGHALRCVFGLFGMLGAFYGYGVLPLATVTALGFTMPFFLTALSVPLLKERVGWRRWTAVLVGFAGVLVMLEPWAKGGPSYPMLAVGLVLLGALGWALAMISIRRLGQSGENSVSIVLWFAIGSALVSVVFAVPAWVWPDGTQWLLLIAVGLISAVAQLLMTAAYRAAAATMLAPFEYSGIVWTTMLGALFWAEWPDGWALLGIAILVSSGLFIWWREVSLGVRR